MSPQSAWISESGQLSTYFGLTFVRSLMPIHVLLPVMDFWKRKTLVLTFCMLAADVPVVISWRIPWRTSAGRCRVDFEAGVGAFHAHLPQLRVLRCSLFAERTATWQYAVKSKSNSGLKIKEKSLINLSPLAATFLRKHNLIPLNALERMLTLRTTEHNVASGPFEPVSGAAWAILDLFYDSFKGMGEILTEVGHTPYLGFKAFDKGKAALRAKPDPGQNGSPDQRNPSSTLSADPASSRGKHSYPGSLMLKGTLRLGKAAARAPGAFTSAMASGAQNLPLSYNDPTVRPTPQITGIGSGIKAGVAELGFGVYDGIAGLFTQPIIGAIHPSRGQHGSQKAEKIPQPAPKDSHDNPKDEEEPPWTVGAGALGFAKGLGRGALRQICCRYIPRVPPFAILMASRRQAWKLSPCRFTDFLLNMQQRAASLATRSRA